MIIIIILIYEINLNKINLCFLFKEIVIVCTPETLQDVNAIKKKINKDRLPSLKSSKFYFDYLKRFIILFLLETVGANIFELVSFHRLSKTYESNKIEEETSTLKANIGFVMKIHLF